MSHVKILGWVMLIVVLVAITYLFMRANDIVLWVYNNWD